MIHCLQALFIVMLTVALAPHVSAEPLVGVILDGFQHGCTVLTKDDSHPCSENRQIYKDDKVTKQSGVKSLRIKWAPYAGGKEINATTLLATYSPPEKKSGMLDKVKDLIGFIEAKHSVATGVTRAPVESRRIPQPGNNATAMPDIRITFTSDAGTDGHIIFSDIRSKEVFRMALQGSMKVHLTPEQIGLLPAHDYSWTVQGRRKGKTYAIRLMDAEASRWVAADLKTIEMRNSSDIDKAIEKVAYLQLISDTYPKEIDLYWLSYEMLQSLSESSMKAEEKLLVDELKRNYVLHVSSKR